MKFVIFHGAYGNANGNWFPDLKNNLINLKQEVILEQFPVENWDDVIKAGNSFKGNNQNLNNWFLHFEKTILPRLDNDEPLCFIGHSLGPVFILHLTEKYHLNLDSVVFVMPFLESLKNNDAWMFNVVNSSFYKSDFDFENLKKRIPFSYAIYSDNDIFVPQSDSVDFANKMNSNKIVLKGGKHINAPMFTKLPIVLELCKSRLVASSYLK